MSAARWLCNKCEFTGMAATRGDAEKQHELYSPDCNDLPAWNDASEQQKRLGKTEKSGLRP